MKSIRWNRTYSLTQYGIVFLWLFLYFSTCSAMEVPIYDFPITAYSQNINDYIASDSKSYTKSLLTPAYQHTQLKQFYKHYYSSGSKGLSPWSKNMIKAALPFMKEREPKVLEDFNNENKTEKNKHYAENFKEHDQVWWSKIKENVDLSALLSSEYKKQNKAISVRNTHGRALPDAAPDFFHASLPGQGFPFDNLQHSAIWAGTPLYVFSVSKDRAWSLVLTPDAYFAWVKSDDIAYVSSKFIKRWQKAAQRQLIVVTKTETSIFDKQKKFQLQGYIGAVFPMIKRNSKQTSIFLPIKSRNNQAAIRIGIISNNASKQMPLPASPKNFAKIIKQLQGRPYGWGGAFFFNDCSQEIKSIFTPFGIWLPRNSSRQVRLEPKLDLSKNSIDERINLLIEKGEPLMTLIYIPGHVMLYIGNRDDLNDHKTIPISYQNVWGMSSRTLDKRYVIGQSLFLPLLKSYPENPDINSLLDKSKFILIYLNKLTHKAGSPSQFALEFLPSIQ